MNISRDKYPPRTNIHAGSTSALNIGCRIFDKGALGPGPPSGAALYTQARAALPTPAGTALEMGMNNALTTSDYTGYGIVKMDIGRDKCPHSKISALDSIS